MEEKTIASFKLVVTAADNAAWQGVVEADGKSCHFTSELQLLQWMMEQYPVLQPQVRWEVDGE